VDEISTEDRLTAVAANFPGLIYRRVLHPDGSVSYPYLSPGIEELVGMTPAEGKQIVSLEDIAQRICSEDRERWIATLRETAESLAAFKLEGRVIGPDGGTRWVRTAARTQRRLDGAIVWDGVVLDVTDLKNAIRDKDTLLRERNLLLREVYHRVKNNMQVVDSLIAFQAGRLTDATAKGALEGLRHRVHALGLVHQQLMQSSDLTTFDIRPFLEELSANLAASFCVDTRGIDISVDADPLRTDLDFAIPLGLLVTEFVTNALKHGFTQGETGLVSITLRRRSSAHLELTVLDNGLTTGTPSDTSSEGIDSRITRALVQQLDGELTVLRDQGTKLVLTIPHAEVTSC